ncbi:hypothetical protein VOLCADRAFT_96558 [Volvox carteri f. nagariensis]|uniref:Right handed beta helix domain-containing protein n=1 Tax=Volvox carteri f. nagariensis TaxID=3068 RepID=D8UAF0_VOLCA|nr:uncharacterized protein VOLCADRAFT_96558 [Volvox carteri f. nagariensis]EFJ43307.1 hypothetical protein VOLCADRAFT_96558 [Volvox carteri f. nagariensis]|eukprot:XP_002955667.1 hypothetical protein VOLCADRAFT_96558 [Volvox carteri f. nagariensis]
MAIKDRLLMQRLLATTQPTPFVYVLCSSSTTIAQVHQLSNAQTQPTHTCRVILRGTPGSAGDPISLDEFSLNCWTGDQAGPNTTQHTPHSSTDTPVRVQLGKELLEFLGQKTSDLLGVSSDWSARPLTPVSRDGSPADDGYELSRSEDWGLDIINVPHLKLVDSVISGVPLSDVAPLLQCLNCSRLTAQNVTIKALQRPSNKAPFGAVRITGLQDAILEGIECSNIRDAMGWACILIQAQAKSSIIVRDSSFLSNSVKRYYLHDFLRSSDSGLPPFPELQYSSPPTAGANLSSTSMSAVPVLRHALICKTDGGYALHDDDDPQIDGYGSVLIVYDRDDNLCGTQHPLDDAMNATVLVERTTISHNMGACGAGIAVQSPSFPQMVGCLSNRHVQLTFVSSIIMYNEADQLDGGGGGGLYFRDSWGGTVHLTIRNESILSSNRACCGVGGAAALQSDSIGDVMFVNTQVSNNTGDRGGGLYLGEFVNLSGLLVYNSTFSNNHALYLGGAIYVEPKEASNGVIKDIRFDGGSILHGNSAYEQGGAIYVRFRGNTATPELTRLVVDGASQMSENQAKNGGAICIQGYNAAVTVNEVLVTGGSELAGNLANNGDGGAIYLSFQGELSNFTIMGASRFSRNTANCTKTDCTSSRGGAIYLSAGKVKHPVLITGGASILSNSAKDAGGAIYMDNGDHSTGLVVSGGSNISCNMAGPTGGAIHIYTASSWAGASYLLQFDAGAVASYNTAQTSGGFLYMFGHAAMEVNLIVNSCNFIQNTAVQGSGGAVYMLQMQFLNVAIDGGSTIALNTAKRQGGAFSLDASRIDLDITGASSISDNLAVGDGGGIYLTAESTDIHVHGSMLSNNKATSGNGGAMSAEGNPFFIPPQGFQAAQLGTLAGST